MKKFLTLLFAFTCLAFSEMRGQNVYFFSKDMGGSAIQMSTVDGINYNCNTSGISLDYPYFVEYSGSQVFGPNSKVYGTSNFPTGIAKLTVFGLPGPVDITGGLKIFYNIQSKEYVFAPNCGSSISSQNNYSTIAIYGSSCKLEVSSSGFSNFQWKRNGIDIPGANSSTYFHPGSLTNPNYVYSCSAFCSTSGEISNSNDLTINTLNPTFNLKAELDSNFCQSKSIRVEVNGSTLGWETTWKKNGSIIPGVTGLTYNAPPQIQNSFYSAVANCPSSNNTRETNSINIKGSSSVSVIAEVQVPYDYCSNRIFKAQINPPGTGWVYQWKKDGQVVSGATDSLFNAPPPQQNSTYSCVATCSINNGSKESNSILVIGSNSASISISVENADNFCGDRKLSAIVDPPGSGWVYRWKKDGQLVSGVTDSIYSANPVQQLANYSCLLTCPLNNGSKESNSLSIPGCYSDSTSSSINYLLVQNVTTTGNNASNKTIQVQFDLGWGKTWWDDINWDAAWVFMKYKTASGEWKHAKINPTGYDVGQGSPSIIQPTADKMGAFVRLGQKGQGNFNAQGMQLQWNYGLDGLNSVNGLEVKVFAIEMVYQTQGDFSLSRNRIISIGDNKGDFYGYTDGSSDLYGSAMAPGDNITIVNSRLSPLLTGFKSYSNTFTFRIKGDAGLDLNADGSVDNTIYPTGYYPFYMFKYEMSEQQYADFLNCLTNAQVETNGIAGTSISLQQGKYFASSPNRACNGASAQRLFAYADWSGLRPMSFFELHKAWNGPNSPNTNSGKCTDCWNNNIPEDASGTRGAGYFGAKDIIGNVGEPFFEIQSSGFSSSNGDGQLLSNGSANQSGWLAENLLWGNFGGIQNMGRGLGFRLCRSAE